MTVEESCQKRAGGRLESSMHGVLYVCLPRSEARSSLQARKKVCEYLTQEGFDRQLRFAGHGDYFSVGRRSWRC